MPQSFVSGNIHIVFSTRDRQPTIPQEVRNELHAYLGGAANKIGCNPILVGGTEDHVHMLVRQSRTVTIADLVRGVKANSSAWMKQHVPHFAWQEGYGAFAFTEKDLPRLLKYVQNQEEHHRKASFQDELRAILSEEGLEWDERYVWQ